jgi:hypothetical protein
METENIENITQPVEVAELATEQTPAVTEPAVEQTPTAGEQTIEPVLSTPAIDDTIVGTPTIDDPIIDTPMIETPITETTELEQALPTSQYALIGQETRLRVTELSTTDRNTLAMESVTLLQQIASLQEQRNAIISQFNIQLRAIDDQIISIKAQSESKAANAVVGRISESILCDIYQSTAERISLPTGVPPTERAQIIAVTDLTHRSQQKYGQN